MSSLAKPHLSPSENSASFDWVIVFNAIRDGVAVGDAAGRIQRVNEGFASLLGIPQPVLVWTLCTGLWGNLPEAKQPFTRAMQRGRRENIELEYGSRRLSILVHQILDDSGIPAGADHLVCDVT